LRSILVRSRSHPRSPHLVAARWPNTNCLSDFQRPWAVASRSNDSHGSPHILWPVLHCHASLCSLSSKRMDSCSQAAFIRTLYQSDRRTAAARKNRPKAKRPVIGQSAATLAPTGDFAWRPYRSQKLARIISGHQLLVRVLMRPVMPPTGCPRIE
jgi:hypothetical protein